MQTLIAALKSEITRLARKEARSEIEGLKKAVHQQRSDIAALKRKVVALERAVKLPIQKAAPVESAGQSLPVDAEKLRFRPQGLASHRKRLGLSAQDMGKLLGVTGQSVAAWETGKTQPRRSQLVQISAVRQMGKREAQEQLAKLQS